jgi:hypothetical protein
MREKRMKRLGLIVVPAAFVALTTSGAVHSAAQE